MWTPLKYFKRSFLTLSALAGHGGVPYIERGSTCADKVLKLVINELVFLSGLWQGVALTIRCGFFLEEQFCDCCSRGEYQCVVCVTIR
jgi:hypothetical protein